MTEAVGSAVSASWYFVAALFALLISLDITVLQHLPETTRTNLVLLIFWLLLGLAVGGEIWLRNGSNEGMMWLEGYLLELVFSVDRVFVVMLIFMTLDTPRRLMSKALFVTMFTSLAVRWLFIVGLAPVLAYLAVVPYALGLWLVYCGTRLIAVQDEADDGSDVTQSTLVCAFRRVLGDRLGEFYDEDDEAVFAFVKQKRCVTLLGVALVSVLVMDSMASVDLALVKQERVPSAFLDISSAAISFFVTRALFFVVRDITNIFGLGKYCLGAILFFIGSEMLLAQMFYVNAVLSAVVIGAILAVAASISWAQAGPHFKFLV